MDWNTSQKEVINYGDGTLLVEAGPGSGKTTVIVARIMELIKRGVDPESFLVITFTTKAADNLKSKLRKELSNDIVMKMQISTIHSFCLDYLKSKNQSLKLLDDDTSEKKMLFIKKFRNELGFINESTVLDYHYPAVLNKFGEYTCFNVETEHLIEEIKNTRPITSEYLQFVKSHGFFSKKRIDDYDKPLKKERKKNPEDFDDKRLYSKSWYNARYLQIAKAYPIYLELMDKYDYADYDTLQMKTLQELEKDSETRFDAIFVDEFQDTDPLQFRIFEILRNDCEYFTAVGDVDQHIYAFRSSFNDFFDELIRLKNLDSLSLDVNYRSTDNIVELTEEFIAPQRKETSQKHMKSVGKGYNNPNFLIRNSGSEEEAERIYELIKNLIEKTSIKDSDIAILYRKHSDKTLASLISKFEEDDDIDYSIRGQSDFSDQNEIKSMITMLWYVSRKVHEGYVPSSDELNKKKEVNFYGFCADYFKPSLAESTKEYLKDLQQSYYDDVMAIEPDFRQKEGDGISRAIHTLKKNKTQDTLVEMFINFKPPSVNPDEIEDDDDRQMFKRLECIRENMNSEEPPTILEVFYDLLSLVDWFDDVENNNKQIANLAMLTQTISNYESFISETDVRGLLFFIRNIIENYESYKEDGKGVQMMTIHSAKGLEFPVTIITSIEKGSFPGNARDPERNSDYIYPNDTYYTPNECLKYKTVLKEDENGKLVHKTLSIDEENQLEEEEEDRILYVAMTRAADLLVLSTIGEVPDQIERIRNQTTDYDLDALEGLVICGNSSEGDDETTVLNYSKYTKYLDCKFKYHMGYNLGFARPGVKFANRGTVFHNIMEKTNQELIKGNEMGVDDLIELIDEEYTRMFVIEDDPNEYEEFRNNVINYYEKYSLHREVLDAELDFEIDMGDYLFNGAIDLIYKDDNGEIIILDYKYAEYDEEHIDGYIKQLHLYAAALKEVPKYRDCTIKKAITHFVLNDYRKVVDINEEIINNELNQLDDVAKEIKNPQNNFKKTEDCGKCSYRIFCKKQ